MLAFRSALDSIAFCDGGLVDLPLDDVVSALPFVVCDLLLEWPLAAYVSPSPLRSYAMFVRLGTMAVFRRSITVLTVLLVLGLSPLTRPRPSKGFGFVCCGCGCDCSCCRVSGGDCDWESRDSGRVSSGESNDRKGAPSLTSSSRAGSGRIGGRSIRVNRGSDCFDSLDSVRRCDRADVDGRRVFCSFLGD